MRADESSKLSNSGVSLRTISVDASDFGMGGLSEPVKWTQQIFWVGT